MAAHDFSNFVKSGEIHIFMSFRGDYLRDDSGSTEYGDVRNWGVHNYKTSILSLFHSLSRSIERLMALRG